LNDKPVYALAISPHPFDNELGIAGTVAHWTREGKEVVYVVCTNGEKGVSDPKWRPEDLGELREKEQIEAAKILGVKEVVFLHHPDLGLVYTPEFRFEILRLVLQYRPEIVVTCDPFNRLKGYFSNQDHRVIGQIVLDVIWPYALTPNTFRDLFDKGLQPHRVKELLLWQAEEPNISFDITDTYDIKMKAFMCNKSQMRDPPKPEFAERMLERAKQAAEGQNYQLGESFKRVEVPGGL
jgi:LmbE family N-acetylglucosaminyl deacetylase